MPANQVSTDKFTWSGLLSGICGGLCAALGAAVMYAWHSGNVFLVQIHEDFVQMQYLTAFCFLLSGVGLILNALRCQRLVTIFCGAVTGGVGLLLSVEYLTGWQLGSSLILPWLPQVQGLWARVSPASTAVGFALTGSALLLVPFRMRDSPKRLVIWILGTAAVSLGLMALCAYRLGVRMMFVPGDAVGMAVHSAAGLMVLGIGLLSAQWARPHRFLDDRWLPVPLGLGILVGALMLWQALTADRNRAIREQSEVIAKNVAADALSRFTFCLRSLERIARRWERTGNTPYPEWFGDARDCMQDEAVFETVGRTDAQWRVTWVELDEGAEPLQGHDFHLERRWDALPALEGSIREQLMYISPTVEVRGKDKGFLVFFPTFDHGQFAGFVFGSFRYQDLQTSTLDQPAFATCRVSLYEDGVFLIGERPQDSGSARTRAESTVEYGPRVWNFLVEPKSTSLGGGKLPVMILALGLLLGLAGVLAMWFLQEAVTRTRMALDANKKLKEENRERQLAERNLRDAAELLRLRNFELEAATDKAEAHARAKAEFLANMSHEIRTPLNAVLGMSEMLKMGQLDERQRELVETIHSSGDVLLGLINDILDFSKIESGQLDLEQIAVPLRECLDSVLDLLAGQAARKRLELMAWIDPGVPMTILGDPTRLRQVLVNLVSNAIKFTSEGEVFIRLSLREEENGTRFLRAAVRDTGIGISKEGMERLFGVFSQVDASMTRRFGGTGLGLAISQRLIQNMGGRIWADSEPGKGSVFQFEIPLPAAAAGLVPTVALPPSPPRGLEGRRLLIVEENATSGWILRQHAESWGLLPVLVESGAAALEMMRTGADFDLALLGGTGPDLDAYSLAAEIRGRRGGKAPAVILLSPLEAAARDPRPEGIAALLSKPVKPGPLLQALRAALNQTVVSLAKPQRDTTRIGTTIPALSRPMRILVAEDNPVNQRVVALHLQRMGYEPVIVGNGLEALRAVRSGDFQVVLMDVQMPEMDGLEAAREICRLQPAELRPWMIALTANAFGSDREECLAAGMNDYLSKPVRADSLHRALRHAYGQRVGRSPLVGS